MHQTIRKRIEDIKNGIVPKGYKKTKVGIVPEEWGNKKLGELFAERNDVNCSNEQLLSITADRGVIPREQIQGKDNSSEDKSKYKHISKGDIGYNTMRMWQGVSALSLYDGIVSPAYTVLKPSAQVNALCFSYLFKLTNMINVFYRHSQGLVDDTRSLKYEWFKNIAVSVPSLPEQEKIAEILQTQDKVIELIEKLIKEKKRQKKYLMQQFLTGQKRLTGFDEEWKKERMSSILHERKEKNKDQSLRICSVAVNSGVVDQCEHMGKSLAASDTSNYNVVHYGDVVYTKSPTGEFPFGIVKQSQLTEKVAVSPLYGVYEPTNYETGYFINEYFMYSNNVNGYLLPIVNKGAKNTINISNAIFISPSFYLPTDFEEIKALAQIFKTANNEIKFLQKELDQEKQKKKALMQLLLTGIVRV